MTNVAPTERQHTCSGDEERDGGTGEGDAGGLTGGYQLERFADHALTAGQGKVKVD